MEKDGRTQQWSSSNKFQQRSSYKRGRGHKQNADTVEVFSVCLSVVLDKNPYRWHHNIITCRRHELPSYPPLLFFELVLVTYYKGPAERAKPTSNWLVKQFKKAIHRAAVASRRLITYPLGFKQGSLCSSSDIETNSKWQLAFKELVNELEDNDWLKVNGILNQTRWCNCTFQLGPLQ